MTVCFNCGKRVLLADTTCKTCHTPLNGRSCPSPWEIRRQCLAIHATWTPAQEQGRRTCQVEPVDVVRVRRVRFGHKLTWKECD